MMACAVGASYASFVQAQLRVTYQRIHEAVGRLTSVPSDDETAWLVACAEREYTVDANATWPLARLGLSASETRLIWVLVAQELSPTARVQLRELSTDTEVDLTLDVLRRVVYGADPSPDAWRELSPTGRLRRDCLIDAVGAETVPSHRIAFRLSPRVLALVHGQLEVDDELSALVATRTEQLPTIGELVVDDEARGDIRASMDHSGFTIVTGLAGTGRRSMLEAAARERGHDMLVMDARRVSTDKDVADRQARIYSRECRLMVRLPLVLNLEALEAAENVPDRVATFERVLAGPVFATSSRIIARRWRQPARTITLEPLRGSQRADLWQRALPEASAGDADLLSTLYPLAPAMIASVGAVAMEATRGAPLTPNHVSTGIRAVLDDRMAGLAKRVTITQVWDDLVLPEDQTVAVVELLARIRARRRVYEDWGFAEKLGKGLGVTALFSGPPGTGKTMCAGLIAKDLGTEIYQVDLGKIVSKWVGETEKNLAALFDAAEAGHAVLLFDEADSLFGKRTSVTNSNDRYANQETNFLLQRIESFGGICILTTNHDPAIDEAFRRRLAVHIRFPLPDDEERARLWKAMLPKSAPVELEVDFEGLARKYMMGGGNIRNAVLRAAFLAADANETIGNYHLRQAAQLEYEAMGKIGTRP
jgi:hypothetical protein